MFGAVATLTAGALAALAVQRRLLNPFGRPARTIRDVTDPLIKPIERRLLRGGGNPQNAPWWLVGLALIGGIVTVSLAEWLAGEVGRAANALRGGGLNVVALLVDWGTGLLMIALLVRVLGSWLGAGRFTPWMRPFHVLTEWLLAPLRRIIPPFGPLDVTPIVAWFLLSLLRPMLIRLFL